MIFPECTYTFILYVATQPACMCTPLWVCVCLLLIIMQLA